MNREEWEALSDDVRPAIRFCSSLSILSRDDIVRPETVAAFPCSWCGQLVWVDESQELPAEDRSRGFIPVCQDCVMADPAMARSIIENWRDVYSHWCQTGVIKRIEIDE